MEGEAMMLRLTIDIPSNVSEEEMIATLANVTLVRQGITLVTAKGTKYDVDLVNVDVVPEGRLIQ